MRLQHWPAKLTQLALIFWLTTEAYASYHGGVPLFLNRDFQELADDWQADLPYTQNIVFSDEDLITLEGITMVHTMLVIWSISMMQNMRRNNRKTRL